MTYQAISQLNVKTSQGTLVVRPGQLINLPQDKAQRFVEDGKIKPYKLQRPYIHSNGDLVIPFDSDPKYHWWNGGQSVTETLNELKELPNAKHNP